MRKDKSTPKTDNMLYYGDNLDIMRRYIKDDSVDLIYLDPPFNSKRTYNIFFKEDDASKSRSQIKAFEDTWRWSSKEAGILDGIIGSADADISRMMKGIYEILGNCDMMAYLVMMCERMIEMRRVLKNTGSIYLHCDPTASHYIKILMDAVFGVLNFRNEIVWFYPSMSAAKKHYPKKHDTVLFYSSSGNYQFNADAVREPYDEKTVKRYENDVVFPGGYKAQMNKLGRLPYDVWQIPPLRNVSKERLGYPTQKPELLLERIIKASSNEGDVILDPFCGCGTCIAVAEKLNRKWIGIDITQLAITLIKGRLHTINEEKRFIPVDDKNYAPAGNVNYKVIGEPTTLPEAQALADADKYQFQWWALGLIGARPTQQKKGADQGIDGRLYFNVGKRQYHQVIISVKGGHVTPSQVRDLRGVVSREKAQIGVFVTMDKPTKAMKEEAASAGMYKTDWGTYPAMQILTIKDILNDKQVKYPRIKGEGGIGYRDKKGNFVEV